MTRFHSINDRVMYLPNHLVHTINGKTLENWGEVVEQPSHRSPVSGDDALAPRCTIPKETWTEWQLAYDCHHWIGRSSRARGNKDPGIKRESGVRSLEGNAVVVLTMDSSLDLIVDHGTFLARQISEWDRRTCGFLTISSLGDVGLACCARA